MKRAFRYRVAAAAVFTYSGMWMIGTVTRILSTNPDLRPASAFAQIAWTAGRDRTRRVPNVLELGVVEQVIPKAAHAHGLAAADRGLVTALHEGNELVEREEVRCVSPGHS